MADPHDDDDAETGNDGSGGGGNSYPPSNAAIENVIRSAMALAGQGGRSNGSGGAGLGGGFGNTGTGGGGKTVLSPPQGAAFPPYTQLSEQSVSHRSILSSSPGPPTPVFHPAYTHHGQQQHGGYLQPQPQYHQGMGVGGMGPAPSSGFGMGQMGGGISMNMGMQGVMSGGGHHAHSNKPVSLPLFKARPHTPIMFHPAAVGVDGRVNLFVGNLPYRVRWQDLKDLFRRAGTVLRADVSLDPQSNRSRGHGTVLMGSQEDGIKAIELFNGYNWQTRILEVRPDRLPPEYEPHPYVPTGMFGPAPVAAGNMFNGSTPRRESARVMPGAGGYGNSISGGEGNAVSGVGLGVGPAPSSSNAIGISPSLSHISPGQQYNGRSSMIDVSGRSISPFGGTHGEYEHADVAHHGARGVVGVSPTMSTASASLGQLSSSASTSPFATTQGMRLSQSWERDAVMGVSRADVTERLRRASQASVAAASAAATVATGDVGTSPTTRRAAPSGLGALPAPEAHVGSAQRQMENEQLAGSPSTAGRTGSASFNGAAAGMAQGGGQGYQSEYDNGRGSLSRSVLQGNFSSSISASTAAGRNHYLKRPAPPVRQDTLGGRLLYVENLPPGMQWQELKDLFRMSGGTVVRADIAQGERGRGGAGYGTVLFGSEMDAVAAVERFDGADYQGKQLQVRQDKTQSGPIPALTPTERAQPPQFPETAVTSSASSHGNVATEQEKEEEPDSRSGAAFAHDYQNPLNGNRSTGTGLSGKRGNLPPLRLGNNNNNGSGGYAPFGNVGPFDRMHSAQNSGYNQSRMGMGPMGGNTMSPVAGRGMPPMTPSMPGFTFHAYPSTPPLMPMGFLSPGLGPFSPALNSPQAFVFNPFMNAAPGAPLQMTPTGPMPPNMNNAMNAPYAMTPGNPLTVDPTSLHHPAHPDYFPPQSPISNVPMGYPGFGGPLPGLSPEPAGGVQADAGKEGTRTPVAPHSETQGIGAIVSTLSRLSLPDNARADLPSASTQVPGGAFLAGVFSSRASFVSTRPEGLSAAILVDRDRRASMNDMATSGGGFSKNDHEDKAGA
ncbi:hypothetical protein QFC21_006589 [Naganishia friedmannii]|uniref:Uncharacterized protein n=1 Tax=Naganishia friedmannii TaxID=89922 RepID=A0ACC2V1Y2_9TREE|nr:hypothetical protein QFC21_006589 [Naganishia friedmannii]